MAATEPYRGLRYALDEFGMLDHFNHLDADGIKQGDGIPSPNIK